MAFETSDEQETLESVRTYYGEVLQSTKDLKTSACCTAEALPPWQRAIVDEIHPEVVDRFYGCGSPIPLALDGATVLDLGCGTGRDCFMLAKLVGERGRVIGVDMTDAQLEVARRHERYHADPLERHRIQTIPADAAHVLLQPSHTASLGARARPRATCCRTVRP